MTDLLRDLLRAKAVFQLRAIEAALCANARSKPDQNFAASRATVETQTGGEG